MCNLNSNGDTTIKHLNLGCVFFDRIQKPGFVISDHMDSSIPKDPKKVHLTWQQHVLVFLISWGKKQQTDPRGEDKKEKQYKLRLNIWNVYISAETQLFSNRIHLRIVKL